VQQMADFHLPPILVERQVLTCLTTALYPQAAHIVTAVLARLLVFCLAPGLGA